MTGSPLFKEAAQKGAAAVGRVRSEDGRAAAWHARVLISAQASGLEEIPVPDALKEADSHLARAARLRLARVHRKPTDPGDVARLAEASPADLDPETRLFAATALFSFDGPSGPRWKAWNPRFKELLATYPPPGAPPCERGSREGEGVRGRLRATALNQMAEQIYVRSYHIFVAEK